MKVRNEGGDNRRRLSTRREFMISTAVGVGCGAASGPSNREMAAPPLPDFSSPTVSPGLGQLCSYENAPDAGIDVRMGPPVEVMLAPEGDRRWGFFMFPCIWRLRDGRLVCAVTMGEDEFYSESDYHYLWYISGDGGYHWTHAVVTVAEAEMFLRERFTLANGRQIYFQPKMVSVDAVSSRPLNTQPDRYEGILRGINVVYRLGDLAEECRTVTLYVREPQEVEWRSFPAMMDPEILVPVFKEKVVDEDPLPQLTHGYIATRLRKLVKYVGDTRLPNPGVTVHRGAEWATMTDLDGNLPKNMILRLPIPTPAGVRLHNQSLEPIMELDSQSLLVSTKKGRLRMVHQRGKEDLGKFPNVFRSNDGGRSWRYYTSVPYGRYETDDGDPHANHGQYDIGRAHLTVNMPKGNWVGLLRTSGKWTMSSVLLSTRSYDRGRTWTAPVAIRPSSTNPVGGLLKNGVAYRLYGRPGQFVMFCADGEGKLWGNDVVLVPATRDSKSETGFREDTCANSSVVETGPDRFLVAYTNYDCRDHAGRVRKAVLVRELAAEPRRQQ